MYNINKVNKMKKVLLSVALVIALSFGANAQYFDGGNDGFFNSWEDVNNGLDRGYRDGLPGVPGGHGEGGDVGAPLGSGLVILTALGAGYALRKKNEE